MQPSMLFASILLLVIPSFAQFNFNFGNMFNQQQQQEPQNMASDSDWYRTNYDNGRIWFSTKEVLCAQDNIIDDAAARCDKYLCPHTLSCVHFPHHCPCAFPGHEDKIEFGEGSMACVSKGGFKPGEAARKIELARKGLL